MTRDTPLTYAPRALTSWIYLGAGVVLAGITVATIDAPGRILLGVAALVLSVRGLIGLSLRPRLRATATTLRVRTLRGRREIPRAELTRVRATRTRRAFGHVDLLEIDTVDEDLLVFSAGELGTRPREVAGELAALWNADADGMLR